MLDSQQFKLMVGIVVAIILLGGGTLLLVNLSKKPTENNSLVNKATTLVAENSTDQTATVPSDTSSTVINSTVTTSTILTTKKNNMPIVKIETSKGEITLELFAADAPKAVENFISLTKKGFYNGVIFHRVISGFMIQGGDPTGTGRGGPDYQFADELNPQTASYQRGYVRGTVAMANAGPNTNGSQFFIMHQDYPLPNAYTIFGRVVSGMETVDAIAAVKTDGDDRPLEDVVMTKVEVGSIEK